MRVNYRRFERRRVLSIQVEELHTAIFPVEVKYFQVTKTKTKTVKAKTVPRPTASIRANRRPVDAGCEMVPRSVT